MVTGQATRMVRDGLPLGTDPASVRRRVEALEKLLERAFIVPGINRPIGSMPSSACCRLRVIPLPR